MFLYILKSLYIIYITYYTKLPWDSHLTKYQEKLQPAFQVNFPRQKPTLKKGKIYPADTAQAQEASNKRWPWSRTRTLLVGATLQQQCQASTVITAALGPRTACRPRCVQQVYLPPQLGTAQQVSASSKTHPMPRKDP